MEVSKNNPKLSSNKYSLLITVAVTLLILCFMLLGIATFEIQTLKNRNSELVAQIASYQNPKSLPSAKNSEDHTQVVTGDFRLYPSPRGKYILVLQVAQTNPKTYSKTCELELRDNTGNTVWYIDLPKLLDTKTYNCEYGMAGLFFREFLGWHDDGTLSFLIEDKIKNVILDDSVNSPNNSRVITYTNPYKDITPLAVNHRKDIFLFTDVSENRAEDKIIIANLNAGKTIKELVYGKDSMDWPVFDYVNEGYVYTQRFYTEDSVETKVFFLDMNNFTSELLIQDKQPFSGGRGCGPYRIKSQKKGEIILDAGGCLIINKKYFSNDGYIRFNLTNFSD